MQPGLRALRRQKKLNHSVKHVLHCHSTQHADCRSRGCAHWAPTRGMARNTSRAPSAGAGSSGQAAAASMASMLSAQCSGAGCCIRIRYGARPALPAMQVPYALQLTNLQASAPLPHAPGPGDGWRDFREATKKPHIRTHLISKNRTDSSRCKAHEKKTSTSCSTRQGKCIVARLELPGPRGAAEATA